MTLLDKLKGTVGDVVDKSKSAIGDNQEKINSVIDSVTTTADSRTGGKYSDRITKLKETAKGGVSSLAADGVAPEPEVPEAEVVEGS